MLSALVRPMRGARHFEELIVWQLSDQLRAETFKLTSRPAFARDLKLHSQTEDAVNSVCRNISEDSAAATRNLRAIFGSPVDRSMR